MTSSLKFSFLGSLSRGRALSLLQQCDCTEYGDPFSTAWELLEGEFLRKEVLVNSFLDKMFDHHNLKTLDHLTTIILTFIRFKKVELRALRITFSGEVEEY